MPAEPSFHPPDVLVLAAGGILGEAWMTGVLAGIEASTGVDFRDTESLVGTSAGAIIASGLAGGQSPRRPGARRSGTAQGFTQDTRSAGQEAAARGRSSAVTGLVGAAGGWAWGLTASLAPAALTAGAPGGALVRAAVLARVPAAGGNLHALHERVARLAISFDGRLRVVCVDRRRGRRVVFGAPGAPAASVADAVSASCSVPWIFSPVRIGGRDYVDGGVWSLTNMDVAPTGRATEVLCLSAASGLGGALTSPVGALRAAARAAAALEVLALRRRGTKVRVVAPSGAAARVLGANLMDPRPRQRVLEAAFEQGLRVGGG